jgi:hypothetical protein
MACDLLDTIREDYREQVERAFWSIVQDRAMWDEKLNIIEVVPMASTIKHKHDQFAFTFVRIDGDVILKIDRDDIATLHVPAPSMVQKIILEQLIGQIGWRWAVLSLATAADVEKMRDKKVNASGGGSQPGVKAPLDDPDARIMQLIDVSTGEWCDLTKPVRIRLPATVAQQRRFWRKQNRRRGREMRQALDAHVTRRGFRSLGISLRRIAIRKKVMRDLLSERVVRAAPPVPSKTIISMGNDDDDDDDGGGGGGDKASVNKNGSPPRDDDSDSASGDGDGAKADDDEDLFVGSLTVSGSELKRGRSSVF